MRFYFNWVLVYSGILGCTRSPGQHNGEHPEYTDRAKMATRELVCNPLIDPVQQAQALPDP